MLVDEIVISASVDGLFAAFLADGMLTRLEIGGAAHHPVGGRIGDIVLGRVTRFDRDLGAAFVDLGGGAFGFLARGGVTGSLSSPKKIAEGDAVLVQISREAEAGKAARLTAGVVVAGRALILLPRRVEARISKRIGDDTARARLFRLLAGMAGGENGWFVRKAAAAASDEMIMGEATALASLWQEILARAAAVGAPARLYRAADPVLAAIADDAGPALRRIVADDPAVLAAVRQLYPDLAPLCGLHVGTGDLLAAFGVNVQVDAALEPTVPMPGGGALHIAETPALIAIDVDSGPARGGGQENAALAANLAAVDVLAREIGLRELAGHIVIDFVAMRRRASREVLVERLRAAFATDRRETHIAGYTRLGKVEMMRRRTGPTLRQRLCAACPACHGDGVVRAPERAP